MHPSSSEPSNRGDSRIPAIVGTLLCLLGAGLGAAGIWLMLLGGSGYYVIAGILFAICGALLWQRSPIALWAYAAFFAGTLVWSLWEIGFDWWPLAARLGVPFLIGALLLTAWTGKIAWKHRNGTVRDLSPLPLPLPLPFRMGVPNLGGPPITAGGVAFLSGTLDNYVRAYDVSSGKQLWERRLPAGGQATPMTYTGKDGREYLLVTAGGHGSTHTKAGDSVIAYALPAR